MARCFNCGRNFDYEKYYGICPKCGSYNREDTPEEEHRELHEQYDTQQQPQIHFDAVTHGGEERHDSTQTQDAVQNAMHQNSSDSVQRTGAAIYYDVQKGPGYNSSAYTNAQPQWNQQSQQHWGQQQQPQWNQQPQWSGQLTRPARAKASPSAILIFILLIIGIVGTIIFPVLYVMGKSMGLGMSMVEDIGSSLDIYDRPGTYDRPDTREEEPVWEEQSAFTVAVGPGEICRLGSEGELEVTVKEARVWVPAGYVSGFPEGQNLVAVSVAHADNHNTYTDYNALDFLYVRYGENTYRQCLHSYDMEEYLNVLGTIRIVDTSNINYGEGEGEILVFVPEEVTQLEMYLESRDEDTYELLEIYRIPLEIKPGKEI